MVFKKLVGNEMLFQLVNTQVTEDFALWDNTSKRFIKQLDIVQNINDIMFMKQELFAQRYPNLRKATQYVRDIVVHENNSLMQYQFGFKKTADDQLRQAIQNAISFQQDIREYLITLRKTGSGLNTNYAIVVGQKVGLPTNISLPEYPITPQTTSNLSVQQQEQVKPLLPQESALKPTGLSQKGFELPKQVPMMQNVVVLTDKEKPIYDWAMEVKENLSADNFIWGFKQTYYGEYKEDISTDRVMQIYNELYAK